MYNYSLHYVKTTVQSGILKYSPCDQYLQQNIIVFATCSINLEMVTWKINCEHNFESVTYIMGHPAYLGQQARSLRILSGRGLPIFPRIFFKGGVPRI